MPYAPPEVVGTLEADDQQQDRDEQHPVDERDVDLSDLPIGGVQDLEPRAVAHLDRRARQRKRAGDDGLRRDHRRAGREHDERNQRPLRREQVERILDRQRIGEQQRALPEIVEHQRRHHEREPGAADRRGAEMPHVRVERLGAGDGEDDGAQREEREPRTRADECDRVGRIRRRPAPTGCRRSDTARVPRARRTRCTSRGRTSARRSPSRASGSRRARRTISTVTGTMNGCRLGATISSPSTAPSTEIAGVIIPSP